MLEENKNLKSNLRDTSHSMVRYSENKGTTIFEVLSYTKTNKLISALYMVTDIMDKEEPIRTKLRKLGSEIISDIYLTHKGQDIYNQINSRVSETLSFIEIASSVGIISEMNSAILIKEFTELQKSIQDININNEENWLEEFMKEEESLKLNVPEKRLVSIGHIGAPEPKPGTRIGVQKASTLLQALSDKIPDIRTHRTGIQKNYSEVNQTTHHDRQTVDLLKNKRREEIILVIRDKMKGAINFEGVTITDIKANGHEMLASCGEKTLQRELVSMVLSGVLKKTGEKRWSRYSIKN